MRSKRQVSRYYTRRDRRDWLLALAILGPLYLIGLALVARTGIFLLDSVNRSSGQLGQAALTFLASVLGTCVTVAGLLLARMHNVRTESRMALETVATGLNLIGQGEGYAPSAKVAGALATLIHLDHPAIAIRALRAAWQDDAVDAETVTWLIGEVLETGTPGSQMEAASLLYARADRLTELRPDGSLEFHWPFCIYERWPVELHTDARGDILRALIALLLSRERAVWQETGFYWIIGLLDEAVVRERQPGREASIAAQAGRFQLIILPALEKGARISWLNDAKDLDDICRNAEKAAKSGLMLSPSDELEERLRDWANTVPRVPPLQLSSPFSGVSRVIISKLVRRSRPRCGGTRWQRSPRGNQTRR